ncbi:L-ascorbate metabolism protein UlaG (beta-lactamase superfamily) [Pullulanibacillus pueri]|uniref:MBL fold metallo-hydrolase n=1 Tax=Pullulanibacillus pueri TaxID=1437324 RepID=A0A8J3EMY2_9BACL|nr:MBL fold metallo-hydrolase [Pullulanibacillus pueri]MBM7682896.1 L-ascorbate metabolism protein UlaG (beta-lactamase superfamily) [Pullulanibacillus pueri]GGH84418.1 MBL fold metallo-hydrolase [Pullulanibacillus pueri]
MKNGVALAKEIESTDMPYGTVAIWHLGQSGVIIKGQRNAGAIVIDPYITESIESKNATTEFKRAFSPPISPSELTQISGILVSHYHDDHLDVGSICGIAASNEEATIVVPASHRALLADKIQLDKLKGVKNEDAFFVKEFKVIPIPVAHTEYDSDAEGHPFYFGYFIEVNGVKLFHSGDTLVTEPIIKAAKAFQPDIAFLPINGGDYARTKRGIIGNMNFREATDFAVEVGIDMLLPIHFDLFPNNRDNPAYFVDYLLQHYPHQKFHMMTAGERFIYYK